MDWTEEQITELRADRPVYRDEAQGTALTLVPTGEDTHGECTSGVRVFPHYHTLYRGTLHVFDRAIESKIAGREMRAQAGGADVVHPHAVHEFQSVSDRMVRFIV